ncbi:MAG TPA: hypothetical protein VNN20_15105 [Thermodesulfobacteriota bacterium]|nr:hypothetical protein [Thermodesulfobacteriota bacterium]
MNEEKENKITLYPSNWLYNAGVVGFVRSIEIIENQLDKTYLDTDGRAHIEAQLFDELDVKRRYFSEDKISSIIGNAPIYRNYLQSSWKDAFPHFVKSLRNIRENSNINCGLCLQKFSFDQAEIDFLKNQGLSKFLEGITKLDVRFHNDIAPSQKFPNGFWNLNSSIPICYLCSFIIVHHHLALTTLQDNSQIFINAPSFKVMYHLNKFLGDIYTKQGAKDVRQILGMSVIEYATKIQATLGEWTGMNIEVVSKYRKKVANTGNPNQDYKVEIDFFSLPYEIIRILSDKEIANLLNSIGEFKVLNIVLDGKLTKLVEDAYRMLRIGLKPFNERNKSEKEFLNDYLRLSTNRSKPFLVAQKMLKLYASIEEKNKKEVIL